MTANSPLESPLREGPAGDLTSGTKKESSVQTHTRAIAHKTPGKKRFSTEKDLLRGESELCPKAIAAGLRREKRCILHNNNKKEKEKRRKEEEEEALGGRKEEGGSFLFPLPFLYFRKEEKEKRKAEELLLAGRPRLLSPCGSGKKVFSVLLSSPLIQ